VQVWVDPMAWDEGEWVRYGIGLLMIEFIVIHSGGFLGGFALRKEGPHWAALAGLVALYSLMALGMSLGIQSTGVLYVFGAIMAGRVVEVALNRHGGLRMMMARSAISIPLYLAVAFFTVFVPVPRLGITAEIAREVMPSNSGGIWIDHPERAICGAAIYFALLGLIEVLWIEKIGDTMEFPGTT